MAGCKNIGHGAAGMGMDSRPSPQGPHLSHEFALGSVGPLDISKSGRDTGWWVDDPEGPGKQEDE